MGIKADVYYAIVGMNVRNKRRVTVLKYLFIDCLHAMAGKRRR